MKVPQEIKDMAEKYANGSEEEKKIACVLYSLMGSIAIGSDGLSAFANHTSDFARAIVGQADYVRWLEQAG